MPAEQHRCTGESQATTTFPVLVPSGTEAVPSLPQSLDDRQSQPTPFGNVWPTERSPREPTVVARCPSVVSGLARPGITVKVRTERPQADPANQGGRVLERSGLVQAVDERGSKLAARSSCSVAWRAAPSARSGCSVARAPRRSGHTGRRTGVKVLATGPPTGAFTSWASNSWSSSRPS